MKPYSPIILSKPPIWERVELPEIPRGEALRALACRVTGREVLESVVLAPINDQPGAQAPEPGGGMSKQMAVLRFPAPRMCSGCPLEEWDDDEGYNRCRAVLIIGGDAREIKSADVVRGHEYVRPDWCPLDVEAVTDEYLNGRDDRVYPVEGAQ